MYETMAISLTVCSYILMKQYLPPVMCTSTLLKTGPISLSSQAHTYACMCTFSLHLHSMLATYTFCHAICTVYSVVIDGTGNGLQFYSDGIYTSTECSTITLNHAMLLVGYGTDSSDRDYWILKNRYFQQWYMCQFSCCSITYLVSL